MVGFLYYFDPSILSIGGLLTDLLLLVAPVFRVDDLGLCVAPVFREVGLAIVPRLVFCVPDLELVALLVLRVGSLTLCVLLDFCAAVFGVVERLGLVAAMDLPLDTVFVLAVWLLLDLVVAALDAAAAVLLRVFVAARVGSVFFVLRGVRVLPFTWRNIPFILN